MIDVDLEWLMLDNNQQVWLIVPIIIGFDHTVSSLSIFKWLILVLIMANGQVLVVVAKDGW